MGYLISVLGTLALFAGALWVIAYSVSDNINAVLEALVGRQCAITSAPLLPMGSVRNVRLNDYCPIAAPFCKVA